MKQFASIAVIAGLVTYVALARSLARDAQRNGSRSMRRRLTRHLASVRSAS